MGLDLAWANDPQGGLGGDHADRDSDTSWQAHGRAGQDLFVKRVGELAMAPM